jgi:Nucleotidyl transferase AbiEii toxin, Type IV TA system
VTASAILHDVGRALDSAGIPFMLTGSFASAYHGAGRATMDVDLVIDPTPAQLRALIGALPADAWYASLDAALEAREHESQFDLIDLETGWKVDLIIRKSRPFSRVEFDRRIVIEFEGVRLAVATVEDVILAKLEWAKPSGSARQLEDVAALLRVRSAEIDRPYLEGWIAQLGVATPWEAASRLAGI